jgi:hypothetical protein
MGNEKIVMPDSLRNPAEQASINALVSAAVKEALIAMGPVLERVALTPEKILEMERQRRAPTEDQVREAQREARERALMREDLQEARRTQELTQKNCSHKDVNLRWSVSQIHNYPDRQARGICVRCHRMFQPVRWEIVAPDAQHPRGKPVLVKADPDYASVMADLNQYQNSI